VGDVSVQAEIAAPAEVLYDLIADMPRLGEWSPECERVEWRGGATAAAPGVGFTGHNRNGSRHWSTHGTVTAADRGRLFAFEVRSVLNLPVSLWSYRFTAAADGGTLVTESTEDRRGALIKLVGRLATGVGDREARNRETMTETLEGLRAAAEESAAR
jgi:hypothetical protein